MIKSLIKNDRKFNKKVIKSLIKNKKQFIRKLKI